MQVVNARTPVGAVRFLRHGNRDGKRAFARGIRDTEFGKFVDRHGNLKRRIAIYSDTVIVYAITASYITDILTAFRIAGMIIHYLALESLLYTIIKLVTLLKISIRHRLPCTLRLHSSNSEASVIGD